MLSLSGPFEMTGASGSPVLHEVLSAPGHFGAAAGFALALAQHLTQHQGRRGPEAALPQAPLSLAWLRQQAAMIETGDVHGAGLASLGLDAAHVLLVSLRTSQDVLCAALEAARCSALGAAVVELTRPVDLTASRRLKLAAEKSGVTVIVLGHWTSARANAAQTRWLVRAGPSPRAADRGSCTSFGTGFGKSPGNSAGNGPWPRPAFDVTLLKHVRGLPETRVVVEWDHEQRSFIPPLPQCLDAVSGERPLAA